MFNNVCFVCAIVFVVVMMYAIGVQESIIKEKCHSVHVHTR